MSQGAPTNTPFESFEERSSFRQLMRYLAALDQQRLSFAKGRLGFYIKAIDLVESSPLSTEIRNAFKTRLNDFRENESLGPDYFLDDDLIQIDETSKTKTPYCEERVGELKTYLNALATRMLVDQTLEYDELSPGDRRKADQIALSAENPIGDNITRYIREKIDQNGKLPAQDVALKEIEANWEEQIKGEQMCLALSKLLPESERVLFADIMIFAQKEGREAEKELFINTMRILIADPDDEKIAPLQKRMKAFLSAMQGESNETTQMPEVGIEMYFALLKAYDEEINEAVKLIEEERKKKKKEQKDQLFSAVLNHNTAEVKQLLKEGVDPNAVDNYGKTPLHFAVHYNNKEIVKLLIAENVDIDKTCNVLWTPFYFAVNNNNKEIAELLIAAGVDLNRQDFSGSTYLHHAASYGHKEIAKLLLAKSVRIDLKDNFDNTALDIAREKGHTEIVNLLEEHQRKMDTEVATTAPEEVIVACTNCEQAYQFLTSDIPPEGYNALCTGCQCEFFVPPVDELRRQTEVIRDTVVMPPDEVERIAQEFGEAEISPEEEQELLTRRLLSAVQSSDLQRVKELISQGVDVNRPNKYGKTPLHSVLGDVWNPDLEIIQTLIDAGADINLENKEETFPKSRPFTIAIKEHGPEVAKLLIDAGVEVDFYDLYFKENSIQLAVEINGHEIIKYLLDKNKIDPNMRKGEDDRTLLMLAIQNQCYETAEVLLNAGADCSLKDKDGKTAAYLARCNHDDNMVHLLETHRVRTHEEDTALGPIIQMQPGKITRSISNLWLMRKRSKFEKEHKRKFTLMDAIEEGSFKYVELLLNSGESPDLNLSKKLGVSGLTPLNYAVSKKNADIVYLLVMYGADVKMPNNFGWTPLMAAAKHGFVDIVPYLIECGADVNAKASKLEGQTALIVAVSENNFKAVELLLEAGADPFMTNDSGQTPLDIAKSEKKDTNIINKLNEKMYALPPITDSKVDPEQAILAISGEVIEEQTLLRGGGKATFYSSAERPESIQPDEDVIQIWPVRMLRAAIGIFRKKPTPPTTQVNHYAEVTEHTMPNVRIGESEWHKETTEIFRSGRRAALATILLGGICFLGGSYFYFKSELSELGINGSDKGDLESSKNILLEAIKLDPENAIAHYNLGIIYIKEGNFKSAEVFLKRAVDLDPKNANAYHNLGKVYQKLGDTEKAERYFKAAKALED